MVPEIRRRCEYLIKYKCSSGSAAANVELSSAEPEGLGLYRSSPYREFPAGIIMEVDDSRRTCVAFVGC